MIYPFTDVVEKFEKLMKFIAKQPYVLVLYQM